MTIIFYIFEIKFCIIPLQISWPVFGFSWTKNLKFVTFLRDTSSFCFGAFYAGFAFFLCAVVVRTKSVCVYEVLEINNILPNLWPNQQQIPCMRFFTLSLFWLFQSANCLIVQLEGLIFFYLFLTTSLLTFFTYFFAFKGVATAKD